MGNLDSKTWIKEFANSVGLTYDGLMQGAEEWEDSEEYLIRGGLLEGKSVPDEFWDHYEKVTGVSVTRRGSFFSCSC